MTPTLSGRWQIRLFLLSTVGLAISSLVVLIIRSFLPLLALFYVLVVGCLLDMLYQYIQSFRWDRDWPTIFQVGAGVLEGLLVWFLLAVVSRLGPVCEHLARHICTDTGTVANPVAKVALSRGGVAEEPDEKVASSTIHIAIHTCAGTSSSPDETVFAAKHGLADSSIAASTYPATRLTVRAFQYIGTDYHTHH